MKTWKDSVTYIWQNVIFDQDIGMDFELFLCNLQVIRGALDSWISGPISNAYIDVQTTLVHSKAIGLSSWCPHNFITKKHIIIGTEPTMS